MQKSLCHLSHFAVSIPGVHGTGDTLGGIKLNHDPFSAIKPPPSNLTAERETDTAQLPSQPQAASGPATELTQDPDVDMVDTDNQPDRRVLLPVIVLHMPAILPATLSKCLSSACCHGLVIVN